MRCLTRSLTAKWTYALYGRSCFLQSLSRFEHNLGNARMIQEVEQESRGRCPRSRAMPEAEPHYREDMSSTRRMHSGCMREVTCCDTLEERISRDARRARCVNGRLPGAPAQEVAPRCGVAGGNQSKSHRTASSALPNVAHAS
jgi:hypothetical protein